MLKIKILKASQVTLTFMFILFIIEFDLFCIIFLFDFCKKI